MEAEVHVMENELKTKLENDIYQLSIREMNKLLKRARDYSLRFEQMRVQLLRIRTERGYLQPQNSSFRRFNVNEISRTTEEDLLTEGFLQAVRPE